MSPTEETLTVIAYVCYLLSLLGYCGYLLSQLSRQRLAVRAPEGAMQPALAGAPTEELLEYIGGNLLDRLRLYRNY